jgi:hypothetical protein
MCLNVGRRHFEMMEKADGIIVGLRGRDGIAGSVVDEQ